MMCKLALVFMVWLVGFGWTGISGNPRTPVAENQDTVPRQTARALLHFWDEMDFRDTAFLLDTVRVERNFARFISLFPRVGREVQASAVQALMKRAETFTPAYMLLCDVAERYLYEPGSPAQNEEYFILFLEEMIRSSVFDKYGKVRAAYLLEMAKKNRPGDKAADFTYISREGKRRTLRRTPADSLLLVMFYDSDCKECQESIAMLRDNALLNRMIRERRLAVLAADVGEEREVWESVKATMPLRWFVGFETGSIREKELYVFPTMPSLYLLDKNKRVILKEVLPCRLIDTLSVDSSFRYDW